MAVKPVLKSLKDPVSSAEGQKTQRENPGAHYGMELQRVPGPSTNAARKRTGTYNRSHSLSRKTSLPRAQSTEGYLRPRRGFLSLPIELRWEIYSYLLVVDPSMDAPDDLNKRLDKVLCLHILHVNRQIREEALHILLHKNVWIHFQIGPITVPKHDSYHIYQLGNAGRYAQPNIPISGFLGEKVRQRLVADVKITQRSEFVDEQRWDTEGRAEVRKDVLFAYNAGRFNHLCHLIRRFGARAIKSLDISVCFPEHKSWRRQLSSDMRLGLVQLLVQTKNTLSFTTWGAEELRDRFKIAEEEWRSYSRNTPVLEQFNDELEEIISKSAIALDQGAYNDARCRLSYVDDIQAIHSQAFVQSDPDEEARREALERDMFVIQVLAVALSDKRPPHSAAYLLRKLDLMCATEWFRGGDNSGLLGYACGSLNRRLPKAGRS
ncbi:hypothetical protein EMPG_10475 [Blastomyces silverae]|uniref:F-box domain-containing protein n=1 Tax=Blastomyces silverae TaxID=2060906 RepID=A0A0H1B519_9EURO|nr:hypothetical protein EMPG_10475 [Blastomyces silverae]